LFELEWGEAGFTQGAGTTVTGITETSYELTGIVLDTEYEFYVRSDCDADGYSTWVGPYSFSVGYCESVPTSHHSSGITNVVMGDTSFPVSSVNYYEYTDAIANIQAGTTVSSSVSFATAYTYDTNIWIDLNDDGIFDNATELVFDGVSLYYYPTTLDTSFPLIPDAMQGTHKMRIGTANSGQSTPDPCYSGSYGVTIDLMVNIAGPVTWTGTEWINGSPAPDVSVLVDGTLSIATDAPGLEVNDMTVSENGSVTIESENSLTINGVLTNHAGVENFVVENDGNLIQNGPATNIGEITLIRDSQPMIRLDYTLWSSPVLNQNLFNFSPETINGVTNYPGYTGRIYVYDGENHYVNPNPYNENSVMNAGIGYLFRSPNNYDASVAQVYNGVFKGVPFNGDLSVATVAGNYTSVGNPYPSNLDADKLFASNPELETLYFWTNTESAVNGTYVANNYAVYNVLGGVSSTGATSGPSVPTGIITTGQGFIVSTTNDSIAFNNSMRTNESTNFFKPSEFERHRFWLNLSDNENVGLNQILIGYMENATMGIDSQIDGKFFGYDGSAIYSLIDQEYFTIQARNLPFETSDVIPLGFRATQQGRFKIELVNFDGLFADGQKIYLKDNDLDLIQDLTLSDYEFESEAGEFNERFEIVYEEDETMGTKDGNNSDIQIYKNGDFIEISSNDLICSVVLYDIQGRQLFIQSEINFDKFKINTRQFKSQVLVVQVETKNGKITNKKILN
ncbi:MAG TPA: GEVED domain-containing protein, partial [Moheibacter sp.]|nr:GEVED domain-containing protein [Moheibacter sp.]